MHSLRKMLQVLGIRAAKTTYPTGNPNFSVKQCFPAGFDENESDPFLMCDYFGPKKSTGKITNPDDFDVPWHPHRGMDICTYLKEGIGRHADSLGNRGEYLTPGMQWISVGSGIEHAEGGGTPAGENTTGFQIWINVPSQHKMDDPKYGTVDPSELPLLQYENGIQVRLLAGPFQEKIGPFQTKQPLQMMDIMIPANAVFNHQVPNEFDNCLIYVYSGSGEINARGIKMFEIIRLDASTTSHPLEDRGITISAGAEGLHAMYFAGKRLNEPIAWRGPFVMNTQQQIARTIQEYQNGQFPPKRTPFDYKRISTFPKDFPGLVDHHQKKEGQDKKDFDKSDCL